MWHQLKLATTFLRCIPAFFRSRNEQALVELALRQQIATYTQGGAKPRITPADRAFGVLLSQIWSGWKESLVIVQPDTVVRWQRRGFRLYWRSISKRGTRTASPPARGAGPHSSIREGERLASAQDPSGARETRIEDGPRHRLSISPEAKS